MTQNTKCTKFRRQTAGHIMAYRCTVACYIFVIKSMAFGVASITMKIGTDRGNARRAEKLAKSDLNSNKPGPLLKTFGHLGVVQSTNAQVQRYTR